MPSSRPCPDSFMPPNGHCGVAGTGSLMPMMPGFQSLGHAGGDGQVVGEDVGRQPVRSVVGRGDHVVELARNRAAASPARTAPRS